MNEKVNFKIAPIDSKDHIVSPENTLKQQQVSNEKYFTFFENAPIALWIEDFSKVKIYIEKAVKESNSDFKSYLTNNPTILKKLNSLVVIKEVNATAVTMYHAKSKNNLLENLNKIFTKESNIGFSKLLIDVLTGKKKSEIRTVNKTLDEKQFDVSIKFNIDKENEQSLENVIVSVEDITERVISEQKLNSTKNLLSKTLSSIKDGFVIVDYNSNYLYVNKEAADLLSIKNPKELIGKHIWEEFPEKKGNMFFDSFQKALKTRKPINFENYFGLWNRWFENQIIPFSEGMLIIFNEITEKKSIENKIKTAYSIINKSPSVAFLFKNEGDFKLEFASENAINLFGYSYTEFLTNKVKIPQIVHPDDLEYIRSEFFKLSKSKNLTSIKPNPFRIITNNGAIKWVKTSFEAIANEKNEITHIQGIAEDIMEQKTARDLLFKSNHRLEEIFKNTPLGIIIWDIDFKVVEWNESSQKIFGYTIEEAKTKPIKDLIVPLRLVGEMAKLRKNLATSKFKKITSSENITKDGEIISCRWYNVQLKDVNGNVVGHASLVEDISERIKERRLLKKSEKKYRDIFEKSADAVLIIKNGKFVDCNKSTLKIFEYENKLELLQNHPSILSPEMQADGKNSYVKSEEMMNIALKTGRHRFIWNHQKKNGQIFPVEVSLTRIDDSDNIPTIHTVIRDISERVKQEELEDILYNISKAALMINDFKKFSLFVKSELQLIIDTNNFYIATYNEETGMLTTPIFVDEKEEVEDFPAKDSLTGYVIKTKEPLLLTNSEHQKLIKKGEVALIGASTECWLGVPLLINNKAIGAIVVQSYTNKNAYNESDVHLLEFVADQISTTIQRKKIESELNIALLKAQESDKLKSSFLANMSHEIRTPMNGIIGFSELFLEPNLSNEVREKYANVVINSSRQLLSIVNDILDISKIEAGVVKLHYESTNINRLLDDLHTFYLPKAKDKNLELICVKGLGNFKSAINIDKTKLHQVLTNLLSNAFKFTDEGSIEFGYEFIVDKLQFYVKDSGVGIEEDFQDKIFGRFIQSNQNLNKQLQGTGLGLAISKKIVELFKGDIWLNSNDKGTIIYFTIPYVKAKEPLIATVVEEQKPISQVKNKELTILVAEDEEYNMMYIHELFSKTNYKIIEANNGKKAVELFKSNPEIDIVFLDIKMPIMDGNEAMLEIKKENASIPVIALSAFAMESDKDLAIKKGFNAYLTKPINKKLFFNLIDKYSN